MPIPDAVDMYSVIINRWLAQQNSQIQQIFDALCIQYRYHSKTSTLLIYTPDPGSCNFFRQVQGVFKQTELVQRLLIECRRPLEIRK